MSRIASTGATIDQNIEIAVTSVAGDAACGTRLDSEINRGWGRIIDDILIEWAVRPNFDEEMVAPTRCAIDRAIELARALREANCPLPDWIVPTGDGGIAFRRGFPEHSQETLEVDRDGKIERIQIRDSRIVSRQTY
jgi:hypothetical protein